MPPRPMRALLPMLPPHRRGCKCRDARRIRCSSADLVVKTPVDRTVSSIVTTGCLLVVLLDNGPTAPWIRQDLLGPPRLVGGGCATPITSPDKAEVSGSSPLSPTPSNRPVY